jgi:hypothetical protein
MLRQTYSVLDKLLPGELYASYTLSQKEYVGSVAKGRARAILKDNGYSRVYILSALKRHPKSDASDVGSYRKVDPKGERFQYHVHLFDRGREVDIYSHHEYRPDLHPIGSESPREAVNRLTEHYNPDYGRTYLQGATDLDL